METSTLSPQTQRPQLITTTSLDNNTSRNNDQDIDFNKSTKKLDKIVKKINTINAEKEQVETIHEQVETTNSPEPQVIYLDSSDSPNGADDIQPSQSEQAPNGEKAPAQSQQPHISNKDEPPPPKWKHRRVQPAH